MKFSRKDFLKKTLMGVGLIAVNANANVTNTYYPKANILNFGAKANGKSDDSYAIIKALKELGECYIPKHPNGFILGDIIIEATNIHGPGTVVKSPKAKSIFIMSGVKSSIEGLTFNSKDKYINTVTEIRLASSAMNIKIQDCNFESSIYSAIAADTNGVDDQSLTYKEVAKDIMISNCIFSGRYSRPIYLHSVENISIIDNIIKNSLFDGIRLRQRTGKCLIANNQFSNIGTKKSSDSQDAIDSFWSGSELTITNNMIDNCSKHGLDIKGHSPDGSYGSNKVIISNNQIKNSQHCGILLSAAAKLKSGKYKSVHNITVSNNIIEKSNQAKVASGNAAVFLRHGLSNIILNSNQIINNYCRGIFINNGEAEARANRSIIISDNQCVNNGYKKDGHGIIVSSVDGLIIRGNICENSETYSEKRQLVGIAVVNDTKRGFSATSGIITNNICRNNKKAQLIVPKKTNTLIVKDNLIS